MHTGCTFNHRYVKSNPREVENATWMLTVSVLHFIDRLFMLCQMVIQMLIKLPFLVRRCCYVKIF